MLSISPYLTCQSCLVNSDHLINQEITANGTTFVWPGTIPALLFSMKDKGAEQEGTAYLSSLLSSYC